MIHEYLLRINDSGTIDDTIESRADLELKVGNGLVVNAEYYKINGISSFFMVEPSKWVHIVDVTHVPFENIEDPSIKKKILWEHR